VFIEKYLCAYSPEFGIMIQVRAPALRSFKPLLQYEQTIALFNWPAPHGRCSLCLDLVVVIACF
jgi:hypothetical protein